MPASPDFSKMINKSIKIKALVLLTHFVVKLLLFSCKITNLEYWRFIYFEKNKFKKEMKLTKFAKLHFFKVNIANVIYLI